MQEHDNQILVPPSFIALYADARGRLRESADAVRQRYELCEDLANHLVEHAQTLYHVQAPSEAEVLRRIALLYAIEDEVRGSSAEQRRALLHVYESFVGRRE